MTTAADRATPRIPLPYLVLFAALYALQGVVVAYFFNFNQGYMQGARPPVSVGTIGWVQTLVTVPLILKFLGGPISDRFNLLGLGHRKPYIIAGVALQSAGLIGLTLVDPGTHLGLFAAVAVLAVAGLALYDTCCDGMVLDVTPPADRQRVQGTLVAARFLATMLFSWLFGQWLQRTGNGPGRGDGVLWACAALGVVPMFLAIALREPARGRDVERFRWEALATLLRPQALVLLAFGMLYSTVAYGVEINLSTYYRSLGYGEASIGTLASLRYLGRAVGAMALPLLGPRLGRVGTLVLGVLVLAATTAGQVLAIRPSLAAAWGFGFGAANGWNDALFQVLCMEASDPRMAASTYALFMAASNVSTAGGGVFSSAVAGFGGRFAPVFLVFALGALAASPLLRRLGRGSLAPHFPGPEPVPEPGHA